MRGEGWRRLTLALGFGPLHFLPVFAAVAVAEVACRDRCVTVVAVAGRGHAGFVTVSQRQIAFQFFQRASVVKFVCHRNTSTFVDRMDRRRLYRFLSVAWSAEGTILDLSACLALQREGVRLLWDSAFRVIRYIILFITMRLV
ncbi:hypothetical protein EDWATA_01051 [Edwardsiella tarda ATCC 23685]|uniref:Uncharacterized protein n=1 Tax=Edwardsiella tarda ATCC 23685 TaxID=500638 RepID=D4F2V0_EDWTA|nr:hypothetical protein EDWATA_01051 [Edwardsiella tarda ATCC 23685]